jgi:two-component system cell cycle sensor histidine kinase/response regulator CckA
MDEAYTASILPLGKLDSSNSPVGDKQQVKPLSAVVYSLQIVHDLQTFLSVISMAAEAAGHPSNDGRPAREYLNAIYDNALHAHRLCLEMRAVLNNEAVELEKSAIDLSDLVRRMAPLLKTMVPQDSVIHFELTDGLPLVSGNASQLHESLLALVTNAAEALAGASGCIFVRVKHKAAGKPLSGVVFERADGEPTSLEGVLLEVSDTGCGIDDATLACIRDHSFTTKRDGSGLGLASVRRILRNHSGYVLIDTKQGGGTTVRCFVPHTGTAAK